MALELGGAVDRTGVSEFGKTDARARSDGALFAGLPAEQTVWMSHRDSVAAPPAGARVVGGLAVDADRRVRGRRRAASTASSSTPRSCTRRTARTC